MNREKIANDFRRDLIDLLNKHNAEIEVQECDGLEAFFNIKDYDGKYIVVDACLGYGELSSITINSGDIKNQFQIENY
jgi:hypothetical protein